MDRLHGATGRLGASLLVLGAGSAASQLVLLRELMSVFGGNELITGTALGIWLLLSGLGSALGALVFRHARPRMILPWLHLTAGLLPLLLLGIVRGAPLALGVRGQMLGLPTALGATAVLFLPAGFVAGVIIPLAGRMWAEIARTSPAQAARRVYAIDSAGDAIGGLLFSLILVHLLPHGWVLAIFGWLNLLLVAVLSASWPKPARIALPVAAALVLCLAGEIDSRTAAWRYPGQTILERINTPFAELAITKSGRQLTVFQDAVPSYTTGDLSAEARVHPALAQVPVGSEVVLVGGGVFGGLEQAVKHKPARIDYIELDPAILKLSGFFQAGHIASPSPGTGEVEVGIQPLVGDGRLFLKGRESAYDAILIYMPTPRTMQGNRYYTEEFFREVHRALKPGGVLSFPFPASPNYLGSEQVALERSIYSALLSSFRYVEVLPGETHIYLASDRPVELDLEPILEARGIETVRLLDYDWPEHSDPFRREQLAGLLKGQTAAGQLSLPPALRNHGEDAPSGLGEERHAAEGAPHDASGSEALEGESVIFTGPGLARPNRDLSPRAFEASLRLHARITAGNREISWILGAGFLIAAVIAMGRNRSRWILGSTGFSAMALQLEVLLIYQILLGNLYLRLSLFVTLFLIGAAVGSHFIPLRSGRAWQRIRQADAAILLIALLLLVVAHVGTGLSDVRMVRLLADGGLQILVFSLAMAAGAQFAAAGMLGDREPDRAGSLVAGLYLADLAGAASGTIAAGLLLLPHFGVAGVTAAVLAVKGASLLTGARE